MNGLARTIFGIAILATACAAWSALPPGNYSQTCTGAFVLPGNVLRAYCATRAGKTVETLLQLPCEGAIENIDGVLQCKSAPPADLPRGSYQITCTNIRVKGNQLLATCSRANQSPSETSLTLPCATGWIDNNDGKLRCFGVSTTPITTTPTTTTTKTPTSTVPKAFVVLLSQWQEALEAAQGRHFLESPKTLGETPSAAELKKLLVQWSAALQSAQGRRFLSDPAALGDPPTATQILTLLKQWHSALEVYFGRHFLVAPPATAS